MNFVSDYRESDFSTLSTLQVRAIAQSIIQLAPQIGDGRCAIVVSKNVDFGMARMWEAIVSESVAFRFRVFRSMDDAVEWIAAPATGDPSRR